MCFVYNQSINEMPSTFEANESWYRETRDYSNDTMKNVFETI